MKKFKEAVLYENESEAIVLFEGLQVMLETDGKEFEKYLIGIIEWVTTDQIKLEGELNIPLDYIRDISLYETEYAYELNNLMKRWRDMRLNEERN